MKKVLLGVLIVVLAVCAGWQAIRFSKQQLDVKVSKFNSDAENLILGLQQYKEFTGSYPAGNNVDIAKALFGQTEKKVLILAVRKTDLNSKGEIVDPWGTPLQFYIAGNGLLIRSAGPNKVWEDSTVMAGDDLFRSN